jgi:hypothetical protein
MKIIIEKKQQIQKELNLEQIISEEVDIMIEEGLIPEHAELLQESWLSQQIKKVPDLFGLVSGSRGLDHAENIASEDAWKLFRAMVGPGTDEDTIQEIFGRRADDLPHLNAEFAELIGLARSIKSLKFEDIKHALLPVGDDSDYGNYVGDLGLIVAAIVATSFTGPTGPVAMFIAAASQVFRYTAVTSKRDQSAERAKERLTKGTTGGIFTPFFKLYTKLVNTIPDKSLAEYLNDDGMHEEARLLKNALENSDDPNPEIRNVATGRLHNAKLGNKRNAYGT